MKLTTQTCSLVPRTKNQEIWSLEAYLRAAISFEKSPTRHIKILTHKSSLDTSAALSPRLPICRFEESSPYSTKHVLSHASWIFGLASMRRKMPRHHLMTS